MQFPSDEKLFGLIPQRGGTFTAGNIDPESFDPDAETLCHAYFKGMNAAFESMPAQHHTKTITFRSWAEYEDYDFSHEINMDINKFRVHAFQYIDAYIEDHLNRSNAYIGIFPPFSHKAGACGNRDIQYSQIRVTDYHYVLPYYIQNLHDTYNKLTPDARTNIKKYRLFTVFSALMVLVYYLAIVLLRPLIGNMTTLTLGVISLAMAVAGTWLPYKGIRNLMSFGQSIILCLVLMFINNVGLMCMADPEWHESIFRYVTYTIVAYAVIVFVCHLIQLIVKEVSLHKFAKTKQEQLEKKFTSLMDENGVRLHRYIRLRLLWCDYADKACPEWLKNLKNRLDLYVKEYDRIVEARK